MHACRCARTVPGSRSAGPAGTWPSGSQPMKTKKGPKGATLAHISRRGQSEGVTPPIDQRPSSFLLSFLQFVNFLNRGVDFGRAAAALWQLSISVWVGLFFFWLYLGASGLPRSSLKERRRVSMNRSFMDCFGESFPSARRRGKKTRLRLRVRAAKVAAADWSRHKQAGLKRLHIQA